MNVIIVTGAAGFLGCHLVDKLLEDENNYVVGIDNFYSSTGENLEHLKYHSRFRFIKMDVATAGEWHIFKDVSQIYHLACPASPLFYQKDPVKTLETCYQGTENMLKLARKYKATFLLTSTSEIYGEPLEHPQTEEYRGNVNPIGPRAIYDEGKRVAETMTMAYHKQYGVDTRIVRIFNTYGPKMMIGDGRVVSNFINQALTSGLITVYGDGKQTRSFCYVSDTIRGLIALMNSEITSPVNIGNPTEMTILELAEKIMTLVDNDSVIVHEGLPTDDPSRRKPDITKAKTLLGWEPKISLGEGLSHTIWYYQS